MASKLIYFLVLLSVFSMRSDNSFSISVNTKQRTTIVYTGGSLFINDTQVKCVCGQQAIYFNVLDGMVDSYCEDCLFMIPRSTKSSPHRNME